MTKKTKKCKRFIKLIEDDNAVKKKDIEQQLKLNHFMQ
jgi:hypothetical protein